eukprot:m51a1_g1736 hypothetical protein (703) ;mRNA; f:164298-167428
MGIQGLTTFAFDRGLGRRAVLRDEALAWSERNGGRPALLACDGAAVAYALYKWAPYARSPLDWTYAESVEWFVDWMRGSGVSMRFYFDGATPEVKLATVRRRVEDNLRLSRAVWAKLRQCGRARQSEFGDRLLLPPLCFEVMRRVLARMGVEALQSRHEADKEMAADGDCWGVLTSDSDFLIHRVAMVHLDTLQDAEADGSPEATVFAPGAVARCLGFGAQLLPVFSCLAGNDYTRGLPASVMRSSLGINADQRLVVDAVGRWLARSQHRLVDHGGDCFLSSLRELGMFVSIDHTALFGQAVRQYDTSVGAGTAFPLNSRRFCVSVALSGRFLGTTCVEDSAAGALSSRDVTLPVRRRLSALVFGPASSFVEWSARDCSVEDVTVQALWERPDPPPPLGWLAELAATERDALLREVLGVGSLQQPQPAGAGDCDCATTCVLYMLRLLLLSCALTSAEALALLEYFGSDADSSPDSKPHPDPRAGPLVARITHLYALLQCVYAHVVEANEVCGRPMGEVPEPQELFDAMPFQAVVRACLTGRRTAGEWALQRALELGLEPPQRQPESRKPKRHHHRSKSHHRSARAAMATPEPTPPASYAGECAHYSIPGAGAGPGAPQPACARLRGSLQDSGSCEKSRPATSPSLGGDPRGTPAAGGEAAARRKYRDERRRRRAAEQELARVREEAASDREKHDAILEVPQA